MKESKEEVLKKGRLVLLINQPGLLIWRGVVWRGFKEGADWSIISTLEHNFAFNSSGFYRKGGLARSHARVEIPR